MPVTPIKGLHPQNFSIIIVGAGLGKKIKSHGPVSLIKVFPTESIIEHQLKLIKKYLKPKEIILVAGFEVDKVFNGTPNYLTKVENENYEHTGVLRSIGIGLRACTTNHILVIYGDVVFNKFAIQIPSFYQSFLVINSLEYFKDDHLGCILSGKNVEHIAYGLQNKWSQIFYLTGPELQTFREIAWNPDNYKWLTVEALNRIIDNGGQIRAYHNKKTQTIDIDSNKDILMCRQIL